MISHGSRRFPKHYGYSEVNNSRYVALYVAQFGWFALGYFLFSHALWPSTCSPDQLYEIIKIYSCSVKLPENQSWHEAMLFTWLWLTPILLALEISRRVNQD